MEDSQEFTQTMQRVHDALRALSALRGRSAEQREYEAQLHEECRELRERAAKCLLEQDEMRKLNFVGALAVLPPDVGRETGSSRE